MSVTQYRSYFQEVLQRNVGMVATAAAVAASSTLMWMTRPRQEPIESDIDVKQQSVEIEPGVRASAVAADGKLIEYYYEDAKTCYEGFCRGLRVSNNGPYLGSLTGPDLTYEWLSYQQVFDKAQQLGSAMFRGGVKPGNDTFMGIYSANRAEWQITQLCCSMYSMVYVPLYDTLGTEACTFIMKQTDMTVVVCDDVKKVESILKFSSETPSLQTIVLLGNVSESLKKAGLDKKIDVIDFEDLLELGEADLRKPVPPKPEDLVCVCYTSGTTGMPKGVMLQHSALVANTASVIKVSPTLMTLGPDDTHISYLPMAHMFEILVVFMMTQHGCKVGFSRGDVKLLLDDLQILKPTIFPTVPRLLNRIYDKVLMGVSGSKVKSFLFNLAMRQKMALLRQGIHTKQSVWDRLVFHKVQKLMGGRIRLSIVGSAPLAAPVLDFSRCAFGCTVYEGYGQTEATAGVSFTCPQEYEGGHVGAPLPCCHVKLVDVPEMDYYAKDNKGEVCVRGTGLMKGYFKDEARTKEVIDNDGWLHTGDVGAWLPTGCLKIIDRRKHIFKLAQGEYLAPEKIEGVYVRCPLVAQVFLDGDSLKNFAVAIVVPDSDVLPTWAAENKLKGTVAELCKSPVLKKALLEQITTEGKKSGLRGFEQARDIYLHPEPFSVENGLLTPTFKSKRPALRKEFSRQIQDLYDAN